MPTKKPTTKKPAAKQAVARKVAAKAEPPAKKAPAKKVAPKPKASPTKKTVSKKLTPAAQPSREQVESVDKPLNDRQSRFIDEYLSDFNATAAYKRAGYTATGNAAEVGAHQLLRNPKVAAEVAKRQAQTAQKLGITREAALQEAWDIVKADPRELVEHIVMCCRHCHGIGFAFQWVDDDEHQAACEQAMRDHEAKLEKRKPSDPEPVLKLPSDVGGYGFDPRRSPHDDCPKCLGHGQGKTVIKDTRFLSQGARALFAGIKETKEGFEVKMHPKLDALEKVFKHLGMYDADKPPAANVSVHIAADANSKARTDLDPGDAYLIMIQGGKR